MVELQVPSSWSWPMAARLAGVATTAQAGRMRDRRPSAAALAGCYVISLRPVGGHAAIRARGRAAWCARAGVVAVETAAARRCRDARATCALRWPPTRVVATSPAAVRAAHALQPLRRRRGQAWFAVGSGTAAALRRAGIADVVAPTRMDSEGLLALPGLRDAARQRHRPAHRARRSRPHRAGVATPRCARAARRRLCAHADRAVRARHRDAARAVRADVAAAEQRRGAAAPARHAAARRRRPPAQGARGGGQSAAGGTRARDTGSPASSSPPMRARARCSTPRRRRRPRTGTRLIR